MITLQAFEKFEEINSLEDSVSKHREWLKDYEGKKYSKGINGQDLIKWKNTKYSNKNFDTEINKIGGLGNRLIIEFDDHDSNGQKDKEKIKKNIEEVRQKLESNEWGYIQSSHNGASDYLWIEFIRELTKEEKKKFLIWISPENSEIDLNFSSPNFCFPVLFAVHWKHSNFREQPIKFFKGNKIDYDSLNIKVNLRKGKTKVYDSDGFKYQTFKAFKVFDTGFQGKLFNDIQPIFYDRNGLFWLWNENTFSWDITDEVDLLNLINYATGENVIESKKRTEIINSLKQEGRKNIPQDLKPTWIQFKNKIIDVETGEMFDSSPKWFATNPIPFELNGNPETPIMDKIFKEWAGEDNYKILYEIIAYCLIPDYPIHRIFCLIGIGMNGKSCFLNILKTFLGNKNVTSTELDTLLNSRFEVTKLHKKLACIMGETNFNQISKTSILKRLSGGDYIGFEYKNKTPFDDRNYAKIIIATNNLPETDDKTIGFYRRWLIIDFPNQFSEEQDILKTIPIEEYNNLTTRCITILSDLLRLRQFTNEGTIEERTKRFEDKSNPILKFVKENTENDINSFISSAEFTKKLNDWCKTNRFRQIDERTIGKTLKILGFEKSRKYVDWLFDGKGGQIYVFYGFKWKN